jgi:hypothetical protein
MFDFLKGMLFQAELSIIPQIKGGRAMPIEDFIIHVFCGVEQLY